MSAVPPNVRVGVATVIFKGSQVIVGKRKGSHGAGTWALPGGHLEMGESFFQCAERETYEETALRVKGVKVLGITNDVFDAASKHYITVFVLCVREDPNAEPTTVEPNKCEGWHWRNWEEIEEWCEHHDDTSAEWADKKCFLPLRNLFKDEMDLDFST